MSNKKYITTSSVNHDGPDDDNGPTTYTVYVNAKGLPSHSAAYEFIGAVERLLLADSNPRSDEWPAPTMADTSSLVADYEARIEALDRKLTLANDEKEAAIKAMRSAEGQSQQYETLLARQRDLLQTAEAKVSRLESEKDDLSREIGKNMEEKERVLRELSSVRQQMSDMVGQHQLALSELRAQYGSKGVEDDEAPDTRDLRIEELEKALAAEKADAEASRMALDRIRNAKHIETAKPPAPKPAVIDTPEPAEEVKDLGDPLPDPKPSRAFDGFLESFGESVSRRDTTEALAKLWVGNSTQIDTLDKPALNRAKRIVVERLLTLNDGWTDAEARLAFGKAINEIAKGIKTEPQPARGPDLTPASPVNQPAPAEPATPQGASNSPTVAPELLTKMKAAMRLSEVIKLAVEDPTYGKDPGVIIAALLSVKDEVKMLSNPDIEKRLQRSVAVAIAAETA